MKKLIFIFLLFTGIIFTQPQDATHFGIDGRASFQDTVTWVSFSDVVQVDLINKRVTWVVSGYREMFTNNDGVIQFQLLITENITIDFPPQALPLKNLKVKMKSESADVLGLVYNGQEQ